MTGPPPETLSPGTRPISVAELLARNGTIGAPPVTGRRHRRHSNAEAVTVAELTGEIPVVGVDDQHDDADHPAPATGAHLAGGGVRAAEPVQEPEPRSGAESMSPDPVEHYADIPVDVLDTDVPEAQPATEDSAYVRSYLGGPAGPLGRGTVTGQPAGHGAAEPLAVEEVVGEDHLGIDANVAVEFEEPSRWRGRAETLLRGGLVVLQSVLAVAFGAGLFFAFDQLWRWNNIAALVLAVLVILGLVVGVRVVRKTEDIGNTLIAVAVGALITLGPLALLQSG